MTDIVIVGAGGHARVVADTIRLSGRFHVRGFIDQIDAQRKGSTFEDSLILGGNEALADLLQEGVRHAVVAFGDNRARARVAAELAQLGFQFPVLIHPAAVVARGVELGDGTVVFAGAVINPATNIGSHVIINTSATVDHDCRLGNAVHVGPGVHLAGGVLVGDRALLSVGAVVKPGVHIGHDATVGAGAAVISDVEEGSTVAGVPARPAS
ncbi:MAG TPA: acetyltransferase [Longimicrobiales bacterium]|nr:acetyltransferase [Longimicrobiales bacterium]